MQHLLLMTSETADLSFISQKLLDNGLSFLIISVVVYIMWKERLSLLARLDVLQTEQNKLRDEVIKESFERENRYATLLKENVERENQHSVLLTEFKKSLDSIIIEFKSTMRH